VGSEAFLADEDWAEEQIHSLRKTESNAGQGPTKYNTIGHMSENEFVYPIRAHYC
jgi:hypothetical protein